MKVVALVSGGKDSCYSMHLCTQHGHEVVALANLLPAEAYKDDLDSYMYQTVGHQLLDAYAACTGLPLYRRRIQGTSKNQSLEYSSTAGDEVEDLWALLAYVKEHHPDVTAVASGAIASDYQRLRVEQVCARLGLVSLAYLWHLPQTQLLQSMIDSGIEAVLVKVAALGLDPHKHLGKSLAQLQGHLLRLRDQYRCNPCGEGGEYETLTLDCPAFKNGRIRLEEWEVVLASPDAIAPVGLLHPKQFTVEPKQQQQQPPPSQQQQQDDAGPSEPATSSSSSSRILEVPDGWLPGSEAHGPAAAVARAAAGANSSSSSSSHGSVFVAQVSSWEGAHHVHVVSHAVQIKQQQQQQDLKQEQEASAPEETAAAMHAALAAVTAELPALGVSWQDSLFVHLYLRDMSHFVAGNEAYCQHLPGVGPPARACVQVPLPPHCPVLLDVIFTKPAAPATAASPAAASTTPTAAAAAGGDVAAGLAGFRGTDQPRSSAAAAAAARSVLHVQSISSWAPSCIGPYSQGVSSGGLLYLAGQIPLDPGSMTMVSAGWRAAAWRTLCSCQAVAVAMRSSITSCCLSCVVYLDPQGAAAAAAAEGGGGGGGSAGGQGPAQLLQLLQEAWQDPSVLEDFSRHEKQGEGAAAAAAQSSSAAEEPGSDDEEEEGLLVGGLTAAARPWESISEAEGVGAGDDYMDDYLRPPAVDQVLPLAPVVFVTVPALPRSAPLEVQLVLVDPATAPPAHDSSRNSSSCSDDGDGALPAPAAAAAAAASGGDRAAEGLDQQLQLPVLHSKSPNGSSRLLLGVTREALAAAAGGSLSSIANAVARQLLHAVTEAAGRLVEDGISWRCWYDQQMLQQEAEDQATGFATLLQEALCTQQGAGKEAGPVVQGVPVLGLWCKDIGECGCILEVLLAPF